LNKIPCIAIVSSLVILINGGCEGVQVPAPELTTTNEETGTDSGGVMPAPAPEPAPVVGMPGVEFEGEAEESTPAPEQEKDAFGVTMLYKSKPGGESWFMAADPTQDARFDPQSKITLNSDGSWKMKSNQVRMSVATSASLKAFQIPTYDREVLAEQGYMQSPSDWKNVEMTGFVKLNATTKEEDNFDWYARGGRHSDSVPCEGSSYKGGLHYDGRVRWQKETWHVSYEQAPYKPGVPKKLKGRWVGFKAIIRNVEVDGAEAVRLELWVNDTADKVTWTKVYDMVDAGDWGGDAAECDGLDDAMPITWGGPLAVFRWDNAKDVDFKWMSVREIQPKDMGVGENEP
jgi:hypothetical protein